MTTAKLYPAPGRFARDPETGVPLDAAGETKPLDAFWRRRIAAGDVVRETVAAVPETSVPNPVEPDPAEEAAAPPVLSVSEILGPPGTPSGQTDVAARVKPARTPRPRTRRTEH